MKARLYRQHSTSLRLLRLTVRWITNSSMYHRLLVRITAETVSLLFTTQNCSIKIGKINCWSEVSSVAHLLKAPVCVSLNEIWDPNNVCVTSLQNWFPVLWNQHQGLLKKQLLVSDAALEFCMHYDSNTSLKKGKKVISYWNTRKKSFINIFYEREEFKECPNMINLNVTLLPQLEMWRM